MEEQKNEIQQAMHDAASEVVQQRKRPEHIPEKFWDAKKGEVRLEALLKSYKELEQKFSRSVMFDAEQPDKAKLASLMGVPASAEEYQIELSDKLIERDAELEKIMHEYGFTPAQVQLVYDLAEEKFIPAILEIAQEYAADREVERLISHFGGKDAWQDISKQLLAFGQQHLSKDVLEGLTASYEGVLALYRMMQSDEPQQITNTQASATEMDARSLKELIRSPKYWRERDPKVIAQVTEGFENLYGQSV